MRQTIHVADLSPAAAPRAFRSIRCL